MANLPVHPTSPGPSQGDPVGTEIKALETGFGTPDVDLSQRLALESIVATVGLPPGCFDNSETAAVRRATLQAALVFEKAEEQHG